MSTPHKKKPLSVREERRLKWWIEKKANEEQLAEKDGSEGDESTLSSNSLKRKHEHSKADEIASATPPKKKNSQSFKINQEEEQSELGETLRKSNPKTKLSASQVKSNCVNSETNPSLKKNRSKKKSKIQYYVIFVGNLSNETTETEIAEHFLHIGSLKDVRLLTKKGTNESRGCAYVEFENPEAHKKALQLHHSMLRGRELNVEFTSAGRKTDKRTQKLKEKNEKGARFKLAGGIVNHEKDKDDVTGKQRNKKQSRTRKPSGDKIDRNKEVNTMLMRLAD